MTGGQNSFRRREKRGWGLRARIIPGAGRGRDRRARAAARPKKLNKQRLSLCA